MQLIAGVVVVALALVAIGFTAILLARGWNALREELAPGFRIDPPRPRSLILALLGVLLPVLLLAAFTTYFAIWLLRMLA